MAETRLRVANKSGQDQKVILEPWAGEYCLPAGKTYTLVVAGDLAQPFEIEITPEGLVVYAIDAQGSMLTLIDDRGNELP